MFERSSATSEPVAWMKAGTGRDSDLPVVTAIAAFSGEVAVPVSCVAADWEDEHDAPARTASDSESNVNERNDGRRLFRIEFWKK